MTESSHAMSSSVPDSAITLGQLFNPGSQDHAPCHLANSYAWQAVAEVHKVSLRSWLFGGKPNNAQSPPNQIS